LNFPASNQRWTVRLERPVSFAIAVTTPGKRDIFRTILETLTPGGREASAKIKHHMEPLLSYEQMASELGVPVRSLRNLVYQGVLPVVVLGHRTRKFRRSDVERALKKRVVKEI
jgi:excisionase family DNA binding protein